MCEHGGADEIDVNQKKKLNMFSAQNKLLIIILKLKNLFQIISTYWLC